MALFSQVANMTGLSPLLAPGAVRRSLRAIGVDDPKLAAEADYVAALPHIERRLRVYLPPEEADRRLSELRTLLGA